MKNNFVAKILFHLTSLSLTLLFFLPLLLMLSASLRPSGLPPPRSIEWLPVVPTLANYAQIFKILPFGRYVLNSTVVVIAGTVLTLLTASWAGFGMSLLGRRARSRLLMFSMVLLLVPISAFLLTRFLFFSHIGMTNSHFALVAQALMGTNPLFILLFYWTFRRADPAVFESSELDGANLLQVWWHMAMPLARPTILAVGMLSFLFYWNDFINPLLYLRSQTLYTLPIGLLQLQEMDKSNWPMLMAASVVMTVPVLVVFFVLQQNLFLWEHDT